MKRLNANVRPANGSLEQAPKVFQSVGMDVAANIFPRMVNHFMDVILIQSILRAKRVGKNVRAFFDMLANLTLNSFTFGIGNMFQFHFTFAFQKSHDNFFSKSSSPDILEAFAVHVAALAPNISFIRFDIAGQFIHAAILNSEPDTVKHEPSSLLSDAQCTGKLARADAVFGVYNHPESGEPLIEAQCAVLEDCPDLHRELLIAFTAIPFFARFHESYVVLVTARTHNFAVRPTDSGHEIQARARICEIFNRLCQCLGKLNFIFYTPNIA